jgi:ribonucleoside-triphosphate reductase
MTPIKLGQGAAVSAALPTDYQTYIHQSRYARWDKEKKRRETWPETVDRYINFFRNRFADKPGMADFDYDELRTAILNLDVMPSMRCLMTAGDALDRDNVAGFNCSYTAIDNVRAFDEVMYILMCGTGVGFSVERQFVNELPTVAAKFRESEHVIVVRDSKIGWSEAFAELLDCLWKGEIPSWDVSKVRPAGAPLKTFGGRASGPDPLVQLFKFAVHLLRGAAGRKLTSLECHDLVCKVADIVVVGGVRRSALISLSNLSDDRMRTAKSGEWWINNGQRALANNSVAYTEKPEVGQFMREWLSLYDSKSGERGIFSRVASQKQAAANGRRDPEQDFGTNPCSEIILRSKQFCNLSEVVVRATDTPADLARKVRLATILGTFQATLTNFRYLSKRWKRNTEEEALLGVSLTGIMDHFLLSNPSDILAERLEEFRDLAVATNKELSEKLRIKQAAAITCVKPSGTVSQLVDSASGIHSRYAPHYLRTVRADKKDPLAKFMRQAGFYVEDDVTKPDTTDVFYFPMKAPDKAITRNERSAIEQLELWKTYQLHWCEHKPSVTIYVREHEWPEVGAWVYNNFDLISGVSFLPHADSDHIYKQAPYQEITRAEYEQWLTKLPGDVDWAAVGTFEAGVDSTTGTKELACTAGVCEIL